MKLYFVIISVFIADLVNGQTKYEKDFDQFWSTVNSQYAYIDQQNIDWNRVREIYRPQIRTIKTDQAFLEFLESVINELHNGHTSFNTNLETSNRLIPSGQDLFVERVKNRYYITDLRKGFGAELAGLKIDDELIQFNGKSISEQIKKFLPRYTTTHSEKMYQYALNMLFAGTHNVKREITVSKNGYAKNFYPDAMAPVISKNLLEQKVLDPTTLYVKINNSLGNNELIEVFDQLVDQYTNYKNIIIDLTDTPGGGNTTVARGILGRFISEPLPYQKHEFDEKGFDTKRVWIEYVTPRKSQFKGNIYVLVGRWTGSMGEGIALGFDNIKNATVIGTEMAGLLGAIENFSLSETKIGYQIPTERLYHVNGTPREDFKPAILTKNIYETQAFIEKIK